MYLSSRSQLPTMSAMLGALMLADIAIAAIGIHGGERSSPLSFEERVDCLERLEQVLWRHRIWPSQNPAAKPPVDQLVDRGALARRVARSLADDAALEAERGRGLSAAELQAEIDRMTAATQAPRVLEELLDALDHDAYLVAECLARPALVASRSASVAAAVVESMAVVDSPSGAEAVLAASLVLPEVAVGSCAVDTWSPIAAPPAPASDGRLGAEMIWTGAEAIVWGGSRPPSTYPQAGLRYSPALDSWSYTSTTGAPTGRRDFAFAWTGSELLVWGGSTGATYNGDGARYSPSTDSWGPIATSGAPSARAHAPGVWTGTEFVVWGGVNASFTMLGDGARYTPGSAAWSPLPGGAPAPRWTHGGVWTGAGVLEWGGWLAGSVVTNTGGLYDPVDDGWVSSPSSGAPSARAQVLLAGSGDETIAWGGFGGGIFLNTGAILPNGSSEWSATASASAPSPRRGDTTCGVWTGLELIVWSGNSDLGPTATGARLDPETNVAWTPTSLAGAPAPRYYTPCAWIGDRLLVWGGYENVNQTLFADGATYCAPSDSEAPTGPASFEAETPHVEGGWVADDNLGMTWSGAVDVGLAGLEGYVFLVDDQAATDPGNAVNVPEVGDPHQKSTTLGDGQWFAHLRACDEVGNCGAPIHRGPYGIDAAPPAAPTDLTSPSHDIGVPNGDASIDVAWAEAVDATSGVAGYSWGFTGNDAWTCEQVIDTSDTSATSDPLSSGTWWFHVCAVDQAGNWGPVASIGPFALDLEGAQVTGLDTVAGSGDAVLVDGEQLITGPTQLLVRYSEEMNPASVESVANYLLVEAGANETIETPDCASGVQGDDQGMALGWAVWDPFTNGVALGTNGRLPVPHGHYRVFACATLEDPAGNPLDGDGQPGNGDDFASGFEVQATNRLANPNFDGDLGLWVVGASAGATFQYAVEDLDAAASSGSARLDAAPTGADTAWIEQCFELAGATRLRLTGHLAISGGEVEFTPIVRLSLEAFDQPGCAGSSLGSVDLPLVNGPTPGNSWIEIGESAILPGISQSTRLRASAQAGSPTPYAVVFDALNVDDGSIFADGFETGDSSRWDVRFPF